MYGSMGGARNYSPSTLLRFHNSFLYISNITDIFIVVQKIISWKVGKSELICLHGGSHFPVLAICYLRNFAHWEWHSL